MRKSKKKATAPEVGDRLFNDLEAAAYLSISASTLRKGRMAKKSKEIFNSPPFVKFGRNVRYRKSDIDTWLDKKVQVRK